MRQVVLDTETTGLETEQGHRIIEIGCVEIVNRRLTGRRFHEYLQPDRDIDPGAVEVHGITPEFLADRPRFGDVVDRLVEFLDAAELIIHNAAFDVAFLDHEFGLLGIPARRVATFCTVLDTLTLARQLHPGQRNSLEALCKRYAIDDSQRDLHGALLDAEILADVYLAMTGGQASFDLATANPRAFESQEQSARARLARPALKVVRADESEVAAHLERLHAIEKVSDRGCVWLGLP